MNRLEEQLIARFDEGYTEDQLSRVAEVIRNKSQRDQPALDKVELSSGPENVVKVQISNDSATWYADPDGKYCTTNGTQAAGTPPEGQTEDGNGEEKYGVR